MSPARCRQCSGAKSYCRCNESYTHRLYPDPLAPAELAPAELDRSAATAFPPAHLDRTSCAAHALPRPGCVRLKPGGGAGVPTSKQPHHCKELFSLGPMTTTARAHVESIVRAVSNGSGLNCWARGLLGLEPSRNGDALGMLCSELAGDQHTCVSPSRPRRRVSVCRTGGYPEDWAALSESTWTPGDLRVGAIGIKLGMTHSWDSWGKRIPLTAIHLKVNPGSGCARQRTLAGRPIVLTYDGRRATPPALHNALI